MAAQQMSSKNETDPPSCQGFSTTLRSSQRTGNVQCLLWPSVTHLSNLMYIVYIYIYTYIYIIYIYIIYVYIYIRIYIYIIYIYVYIYMYIYIYVYIYMYIISQWHLRQTAIWNCHGIRQLQGATYKTLAAWLANWSDNMQLAHCRGFTHAHTIHFLSFMNLHDVSRVVASEHDTKAAGVVLEEHWRTLTRWLSWKSTTSRSETCWPLAPKWLCQIGQVTCKTQCICQKLKEIHGKTRQAVF